MNGRAERRLAETGEWGTVEYVVRRNGHSPASEFIEALSLPDRAKLASRFQTMARFGRISNLQKFKKVAGSIFEFKSFQIRIGCFQVGRTWLLTHGFVKKRDRWPKSELDRASEIRDEYLADNPSFGT
jgi:hypothetical protein